MLRFRESDLGGDLAAVSSSPFLSGRREPGNIGILNDYVRIPYANGSSFASQFLYRALGSRGHQVTVVGPRDPLARPEELPRRHIALPSLPLRNYPGVHLPIPSRAALDQVAAQNFDLLLGNTGSAFLDLGVWLRATHGVPFVCVNTVHLPSVCDVVFPESMSGGRLATDVFQGRVMPWLERINAEIYNRADGLVVLSRGLERYWRERGVTVPIHVIPRAIDPTVFDVPIGEDPFAPAARKGFRLLCVCRHTREKGVIRLIRLFARRIAPAVPEATLTLVGDGPDHEAFRQAAREYGVEDRVFFPGEQRVSEVRTWYAHADLFVYTSLSETYGQVVGEALFCGLPVAAFADDMGVSQQVEHGQNGLLLPPGPDVEVADHRFASEIALLLKQPARRRALAATARELARRRSDPDRCIDRYHEAFEAARDHRLASPPDPRDRGRLRQLQLLARWTSLHATAAGFGLLRPPAQLNKNGRRPPAWDLDDADRDSAVELRFEQATIPAE